LLRLFFWSVGEDRTTKDPKLRIMPCPDMQNGPVVKGVHFVDIKLAGDPVTCAKD
jgi:hypothetical protein